MKKFNLAYPEKSDIEFRFNKYPDGQQNISINPDTIPVFDRASEEYLIKSRLNNFKDLELIICSVASLRNLGVKHIHLYTPYFLGGRSDRKFEIGGNNYLKEIICPIVNGLNFESVTCVDPHSDVLEACINNFKRESNDEIVKFALSDIYDSDSNFGNDNMIIISPDAGANKKIYKIASEIDYEGDIVTCGKDRGVDGKINNTIVPNIQKYKNKDFVIIDDICDGGATFNAIGYHIRLQQAGMGLEGKRYLIVTHGIFSKGFEELQQYFDTIYTTNSFQTLNSCEPFVKQLNIF